jgi:hypothetical protein
MILEINNKIPICSHVTEFYGIKIPINDIMTPQLLNGIKIITGDSVYAGDENDALDYIDGALDCIEDELKTIQHNANILC